MSAVAFVFVFFFIAVYEMAANIKHISMLQGQYTVALHGHCSLYLVATSPEPLLQREMLLNATVR